MSIAAGIQAIEFEDHHVHAPEKVGHRLALAEFRRPFTESAIPEVWAGPLGSQIGYRWMVRTLAGQLGVEPDEQALLEARNAIPEEEYHRRLADAANLGDSYADYLFSVDISYSPEEWSALLGGRSVHRLLRIETFVERLHAECPTLDDALERLDREIRSASESGLAGLKSIAGYRTGLAFDPPSLAQRRQAALAYAGVRERLNAGLAARIQSKALVDTIVWTAIEAAVPAQLPIQFHVAFGDDDIVLTQNDPSLMRALLQHEPFRAVPLVLLHCYPYHRTAAYLASLYPNVYVDLSLTIPIVGHGAARVLSEALELAPVDQMLASTDGHMTPEFQWFGIHVWRWALARVLDGLVADDFLDMDGALDVAAAIMRDNTRRIYPAG